MEHCGYVVKIEELRKHSNADRLQVATIFGNSVIVDLNTHVGDIGVYFPVDLQLSEEFCKVNDLVRRKDENGKDAGGYIDPNKRNIRAMRLRGEVSDGLYLPITCLAEFTKISDLTVGTTIDNVNGHEICCKYIPRSNTNNRARGEAPAKKAKANFAPTFYEHVDTAQLAYNMDAFKNGDIVQLTLKMHGTSARTGYLPLIQPRTFIDKLLRRQRKEYGYVSGTRRVVLDNEHDGGFYEDNSFRRVMAQKFEGKLHKGEVCYMEIVGFQGPNGAPIMASASNSKIFDKNFVKQYGAETVFSYGCVAENGYNFTPAPCCEVYVYRMTMVNEDGDVVEYSPEQIRYRCMQIGVNMVPEFETFVIPDDVNPGEYVLREVEKYYDGPDPIGHTHIREGVVARILNRNNFAVYKHKNVNFKILSGLAVENLTQEQMNNMSEDQIAEL